MARAEMVGKGKGSGRVNRRTKAGLANRFDCRDGSEAGCRASLAATTSPSESAENEFLSQV